LRFPAASVHRDIPRLADGYWRLDRRRYLELVHKQTRWNELPGNTVYPARKSLLIASSDVRTSNSAAMYLAIASYVSNGERWSRTPPRATR
jgi:hypothetical protein